MRTFPVWLLLAGCIGSSDVDSEGPPWALDQVEVTWEPCSLYVGEDDGLAECAVVDMPLFWEDPTGEVPTEEWQDPEGRTFEVHAKRLLSSEPAELQLWLLDGGPGGSGLYDFPGYMEYFQSQLAVDVYTLDHRGTGFSGRLSCPDQESEDSERGSSITDEEMDVCLDHLDQTWGEALEVMGTTSSSIDLGALIEATREPGERVVVWGGSYGTYWAQRYLRLFPDQADGVLIEAIMPIDGTMIWTEAYTDQAAQAVFDLCAADPTCSGYLGDDPWGTLGATLDRMDEGHCTRVGLTRSLVGAMFAYLSYSRVTGPAALPAATHRLARCNADDEAALVNLYYYLFGDGGAWDIEAYSILLQHHVSFGELWSHPDFEGVDLDAYYDELYADALVVKGYGHYKADLAERWPVYDDSYDDQWPETDTPMLMIQGELDPVTPYAEALTLTEHFTGEHQHFVSFPTAAHDAVFGTPTSEDHQELRCGERLMLDFLADPLADPDTSCVDQVLPLSFDASPALSEALFGTADPWGDAR